MLRLNRKQSEPISVLASIDEILVGLMQRQLADTDLDCDFPIRGRADEDLICGIMDCRFGDCTQLGISQRVPKKCVRVKQVPHGMYSAKSRRCSSSSATIVIIPLQSPGP